MIRLNMRPDGKPCVEQFINRPSIYLDTWMWCKLSEDERLKNDFLEAAKQSNGSIMYSIVGLFELAKIRDHAQLDKIMEVMDSLDYGFIDTSGGDVINREDVSRLPDGTLYSLEHPAADQDLIKLLHQITKPFNEFKVSSFIRAFKEMDLADISTLKEREDKLDGLTKTVLRARQDPDALKRAKARHKNRKIKSRQWPYTKDIQGMLIDFLVVNQTMKMNSNEWIDVWHMVVPVAYNDFVLLDNRWYDFVKKYIPAKYPAIANIYCGKTLKEFFADLRDFQPEQ